MYLLVMITICYYCTQTVVLPAIFTSVVEASTVELRPLQLVMGVSFFLMITTALYQVFKGMSSHVMLYYVVLFFTIII